PERAQSRGLDEELAHYVAPARPEGFPDSDLVRSLGYRDEHDVHDHETPDYETNRREYSPCRSHDLLDLVHEGEGGLRRFHEEVVGRSGTQLAPPAHRFTHRLHGVVEIGGT